MKKNTDNQLKKTNFLKGKRMIEKKRTKHLINLNNQTNNNHKQKSTGKTYSSNRNQPISFFIPGKLIAPKLFLLFIIGFSSLHTFGQTELSGRVTDSTDNSLSYVNVILKKQSNDEVITGTLTDEDGKFSLNDEKDEETFLEISYMGYKTENYKINPKSEHSFDIELKEDTNSLDEILITADKPVVEQKTDRFVFNIEQTATGSTGTAIDALKKTPGVNSRDDKLAIIGKNEVRVLVNDRMIHLSGEELYSYLNSIPSDDIEKIEVLTTPPSKYEAEGDSGLINIVLKKRKKDSWSNTIRGSYEQATYPVYSLGESFLFKKDKLEVSASLDGRKGYMEHITDINLDYDEGPWVTRIKSKDPYDNISGRFNLNYDISKSASIGLLYNTSFTGNKVTDREHTSIFNNNDTETGEVNSLGFNDLDKHSHDVSVYYDQKLDTLGRKLSVSAEYFNYKNLMEREFDSKTTYSGLDDSKMATSNNQKIDNYSFNVDFEHPTDWINFTYGGKLLFTKNNNILNSETFTDDIPVPETQFDNFKYNENIRALYIDATKNFGEKWTAKAGLRYENTEAEGISLEEEDNFKRTYADFFPSLFLNYKANKSNVFNLSYSRRLKRPAFYELNPFKWYINSRSYAVGNPFLQPKLTDNIEFTHSYKNMLISKLFVSFDTKGFEQTAAVNPESHQQIYSYENYYKSTSYGIKETFIYNPFKWWHSVNEASISYLNGSFIKDFDLLEKPNDGLTAHFLSNHNFFLNTDKTLQLEATFSYLAVAHGELLYRVSPFSSLDFGVKALFYDKKLEATLSLKDIYKGEKIVATTHTNNVKQVVGNYYDSRRINLTLSYKFGNNDLKSKKVKSKNDIKERTN